MQSQEILYTNIFGEPFLEDGGTVFKISPETGDIEPVCTFTDFDQARLDDFWTGESMKRDWEELHGPLSKDNCLAP